MAAFDKVLSGIHELDQALDYIRLGDNVVWRVSSLDEFKLFMEPYVAQAIKDQRNIIYFRFANHEPLIEDCPEVKTIKVPLSHRFETFTVEIHNEIERQGKDAFYVFDCLSELQTAWATDMMMGNFFRVTCPFLFILDTVAFFPIIRGKHSISAVNKIIMTTQLFLDVYSDPKNVFVRPEKVWNRNSETMFLPHFYQKDTQQFRPILDGVHASRFYQLFGRYQRPGAEQFVDSWDRNFNKIKFMHEQGMDVTAQINEICNIMMTRDERMRQMVKKHFTTDDYLMVRSHMIGTGLVGGKACGMLLARAIIRNMIPEVHEVIEPHDSFFIGSDMYYTYIVDNNFWDLRIRQRTEEEYFSLAEAFSQRIKTGTFSSEMKEQFQYILEYYGQDPYIIRSSSILEDGFGNAFAGKYDSVFCANRGSMEERLQEFEDAIKTVYASTMSMSALDYRKRRGLDKRDEQMALLIQRVSGTYYDNYYMPCAAGVGYSYSPYRFLNSIDLNAGMLRLVMGMGTSAVDRTEGSYPRLVSLDNPQATPYTTIADKHRFSQRKLEAINTQKLILQQIPLSEIEPKLPMFVQKTCLSHDYDAESMFRERGQYRNIQFISCEGLVKNKRLMEQMQSIMHTIQSEYNYPVDIEYTINVTESGEYTINLLQCRPLQVFKDTGKVVIPQALKAEDIFIESFNSSMGLSRSVKLDLIIYVDPVAYYSMKYAEKYRVANAIGKINWQFRNKGIHMMLMVPGRIGTSSPELGVATNFSDISEFEAICEIEEKKVGYNPELSYGSHIFQDLVEAEILYTALFGNEKTKVYDLEKLKKCPNLVTELEGFQDVQNIIGIYDVKETNCILYNDLEHEHLVITL